MKSRTPKFKAFAVCLFAALTFTQAEVLHFLPSTTIDFESLQPESSIGELGWTGDVENIIATLGGDGNDSMAIKVVGQERCMAWSPRQTPNFKGSVLYFSTWICVANSSVSGARIRIATSTEGGSGGTGKLAGYGVMDAVSEIDGERKNHRFAFYDPDNGGWIYSSLTATPNVWYEVVLVVELNESAPEKSLGSLYYRIVGEPEFMNIPEFHNYPMAWYREGYSALDFAYWRIDNARQEVQLDNFSAGTVRQK